MKRVILSICIICLLLVNHGLTLFPVNNSNVVSVAMGTEGNLNWSVDTSLVAPVYSSVYMHEKINIITCWDGSILVSDNGTTWTSRKVCKQGLTSSASNGTRYVVVGEKGAIFYSDDTIEWKAAKSILANTDLKAVIYTEKFIAVGNYGRIYESFDGVQWTLIASGSDNIKDIKWDGERYFITANLDEIKVTKDFKVWETFKLVLQLGDEISKVNYVNKTWFVFTKWELYYSNNGVDWKRAEFKNGYNNLIPDVFYDGINYITYDTNGHFYQTDGLDKEWQFVNTDSKHMMNQIVCDGVNYIGIGPGVITFNDEEVSCRPSIVDKFVAGKDGIVAVVGENSINGRNNALYCCTEIGKWKKIRSISEDYDIDYCEDKFIMSFSASDIISISEDGVNWQNKKITDMPWNSYITGFCKKGDEYLLLESHGIFRTRDFSTWDYVNVDLDSTLSGIAANENSIFISNSGDIYKSDDFVNWNKIVDSDIYEIKGIGDGFIGYGFSSNVYVSNDGTVWDKISLGDMIQSIAYNGNKTAAAGFNHIYVSDDLHDWKKYVVDKNDNGKISWLGNKLLVSCGKGILVGEFTSQPTPTSTNSAPPTVTPPPDKFKISGFIRPDIMCSDSNMANIMTGFKVEIPELGMGMITSENGAFEFDNLPYSEKGYTISISKDNFLKRDIKNVMLNNDIKLGTSDKPLEVWPGDILIDDMQDNTINIKDIMKIAISFNTIKGESNYNPDLDYNLDNVINMSEVITIVKHFNMTSENYPSDGLY